MDRTNTIFLFDIDGTLTKPRNPITPEMKAFMLELKKHVAVGLVGGSDFAKIREQVGDEIIAAADYVFSENGTIALKDGKEISRTSIAQELGEEKLQEFLNFCLRYIADLKIPVKRGTFIEFRNGMLNVSPIGRNCSQAERDVFFEWDKKSHIRQDMVDECKRRFGDLGLQFSIGGQISFDVFPKGWDKTYCLRFLDAFPSVHFFGDRVYPGGNDYEIYESPRTVGHSVKGPEDTMAQIKELLKI